MMARMYHESYADLPAFQKMREQIEYCLSRNMQLDLDEFTTRMMIMNDNAITWDTTCANCAALLDELIKSASEIVALKEQLDKPAAWFCGECGTTSPLQHFFHEKS